jgi:hypothetical protein
MPVLNWRLGLIVMKTDLGVNRFSRDASCAGIITRKLPRFLTIVLIVTRLAVAQGPSQESDYVPMPPATQSKMSAALQNPEQEGKMDKDSRQQSSILKLPNSERFRFGLRLLAGYGNDSSQSALGFERQGRIGYAIFDVFGKINNHLSYRVEINPVDEAKPLPACGETDYFFPNMPQNVGPNVFCHNDGRLRVDDYRFMALDPLIQQGAIRQAYLMSEFGPISVKTGRFILPIGFLWEDVGSFSAKDATHIQRINAETDFGAMLSLTHLTNDRRAVEISGAVFLGDGNRFHDYDYFYGVDGSLDTNSGLKMMFSVSSEPAKGLSVRAAYKRGETGSKVEKLPNFFASKRHDNATILSVRYQPIKFASVFGEYARYVWGPFPSSASMLGMDPRPIIKPGYYIGGEASYPLSARFKIGTVVTREELSRNDSLVEYLAWQGLYNVRMGEKERSTVLRLYLDISSIVRIGAYYNHLYNPFPWISGIAPVSGFWAYKNPGDNKVGVVVMMRLR